MTEEHADYEPYLDMTEAEFADIILMLLLEEKAKKKLAPFRPKDLHPQPIQSFGELRLARDDV